MKITRFETFLANAGLRNYLFVRLGTDTGLTGVGEASLEWQEQTVQTLCHEWVEGRVIGRDPFDVEVVWEDLYNRIKDYGAQGFSITALSGIDIALWDVMGRATGLPVHKLIGGAHRREILAYATGLYFIDMDRLVEEAVEEALGQSCRVEVVVGNADLDVLGRVGALLRF